MSIENAERFLRRMRESAELQEQVRSAGPDGFESVTAAAGASCTAYELACAVARGQGSATQGESKA
ncbi:MAG: Nif11-like leader peptide family natural product precursor [Pseudomonadales bacterium]